MASLRLQTSSDLDKVSATVSAHFESEESLMPYISVFFWKYLCMIFANAFFRMNSKTD